MAQTKSAGDSVANGRCSGSWEWTLIGLLFVLLLLSCLFWAHHGEQNVDEGFYLFCTQLVSEGKLPYQDFGFSQPSLTLFVQAPLLRLVGFDLIGGRMVSMLWVITGVWIGACFLGVKKGPRSALIFLLCYLVSMGWIVIVMKGRNYALASLLLLLALLVQQSGLRPLFKWSLFTIVAAMAMSSRYLSILLLLPLSVFCLADVAGWKMRILCVSVSGFAGGLVLWLLSCGSWDSFWFWTVEYHFSSTLVVSKTLEMNQLLQLSPLGFVGLLVLLMVFLIGKQWRKARLLLIFVCTLSVGFFSKHYYGEYVAIFMPSLFLILAQYANAYANRLLFRHFAIAMFALYGIGLFLWKSMLAYSPVSYGVVERAREASDFLREHTSENDRVLASTLEIPIGAGRRIPESFSMGVFSISETIDRSELARYHLNRHQYLIDAMKSEDTKALVLSRRKRGNFLWTVPSIGFFTKEQYEKFEQTLTENWAIGYSNKDYVVLLPKL